MTPEYRAWKSIKRRCYNKNTKDYPYYGGRGIRVANEWLKDFNSFYNHIGNLPSPTHSIDRYPNKDGNYEPFNVRWATKKQQGENTCRVVNLTCHDITMNLSDWAKYFNVKHEAIRFHIKKGRSIEDIHYHYTQTKLLNPKNPKWIQKPHFA